MKRFDVLFSGVARNSSKLSINLASRLIPGSSTKFNNDAAFDFSFCLLTATKNERDVEKQSDKYNPHYI